MTRCRRWEIMRCPATITTSTIMPCSGRTSAPTPSGGWRRSKLRPGTMAHARPGLATLSPGSGLFLAVALLCGWALLHPVPYGLCVTLLGAGALAALALPRLSGNRFPLQAKNGYVGASGQAALYLSMILVVRALSDIDMIDW